LGISAKTIQNWRRLGTIDQRKGSSRHVTHRLSPEEDQLFYSTPDQIVAHLAGNGVYLGSASTLYRILRKRKALQHRHESKKAVASGSPHHIPVTGPNQVWSWDITWLKTEVHGLFLYAYTIIDLFDRFIVGWSIETSESDEHARRLFERVTHTHQVIPEIIHADNGNPMRGMTLAVFLDSLHITRSYSRPRCSNDNAFIESWHKTLKYTVGYPRFFSSLENARMWYADFVHWYNTTHLHSGIGYVTPLQRRSGEAERIYAQRNQTILEAYAKNPSRWRRGKTLTYQSNDVSAFYRPLKISA
jgi:putative transposase